MLSSVTTLPRELVEAVADLCERFDSHDVLAAVYDARMAENRAVQDVANDIRAGMGLPPLDPPNPITEFQRR